MAFICACEAVTTRTVREALSRGADSVEEIGELCGAGTNCCGCHPTLESMLAEQQVRVKGRPSRTPSVLFAS